MTKKTENFYLWTSKNLVGSGHPRPSARHWDRNTTGVTISRLIQQRYDQKTKQQYTQQPQHYATPHRHFPDTQATKKNRDITLEPIFITQINNSLIGRHNNSRVRNVLDQLRR